MAITKKTQGQIKRETRESKNKIEQQQKILQQKKDKQNNVTRDAAIGAYKNIVVGELGSIFERNYGEYYDSANTLPLLNFSINDNNDGTFSPKFSINENSIHFIKNIKDNYKPFNENSREYFFNRFGIDEYDPYYNSLLDNDIQKLSYQGYQEFQDISAVPDDMFIPISSDERYNKINKISKNLGYTTKHESVIQVQNQVDKKWKNISNKFKKI